MVIEVSLANNSFLQIQTEDGIKRELREYFAFFADGYRWMPAYKNKMWDGKIRLYNIIDSTLPAGLFFRLQLFAQERQYNIEVKESEYGLPGNVSNQVEKFSYPLLWKPRDYQEKAYNICMENKRRVVVSPTGSGKSLIIYMIVRQYLELRQKRILLIVPTTTLVEQMYKDFLDYAKPEGFPIEKYAHRIHSGADKKTPAPVVISTWQSLQKLGEKWFSSFGMVIGDECHLFKAKALTSIVNKCVNADYRIGTTGTLDGKQVHRLQLEGLFGPVFKIVTTKKLQEENALARLKIHALVCKYSKKDKDKLYGKNKKVPYQKEIDFLISHPVRNRMICNLILHLKGNTLVMFNFVEKHGQVLVDMVRNERENNVYYIHGNTKTDEREQVREIVENQTDAIILASSGVFSTGTNIRNIHNVVFTSPTKSQVRVLQSIGRGLRKSDDGRTTMLYDIVDDLSKKNFAYKHAQERFKMYKDEEFPVKIHDFDMDDI